MKKLCLVVAALASAVPAVVVSAKPQPAGPKWVRVGSYVDGGPVEVDRSSIVTSRGLTRARWRTTFAEPRQDGTVSEEQLELIDCEERLSSQLALRALAADGSVVKDVREPESAAIHRLGPTTPGTTGEMVAEAACRLRPLPRRR